MGNNFKIQLDYLRGGMPGLLALELKINKKYACLVIPEKPHTINQSYIYPKYLFSITTIAHKLSMIHITTFHIGLSI